MKFYTLREKTAKILSIEDLLWKLFSQVTLVISGYRKTISAIYQT